MTKYTDQLLTRLARDDRKSLIKFVNSIGTDNFDKELYTLSNIRPENEDVGILLDGVILESVKFKKSVQLAMINHDNMLTTMREQNMSITASTQLANQETKKVLAKAFKFFSEKSTEIMMAMFIIVASSVAGYATYKVLSLKDVFSSLDTVIYDFITTPKYKQICEPGTMITMYKESCKNVPDRSGALFSALSLVGYGGRFVGGIGDYGVIIISLCITVFMMLYLATVTSSLQIDLPFGFGKIKRGGSSSTKRQTMRKSRKSSRKARKSAKKATRKVRKSIRKTRKSLRKSNRKIRRSARK